MRRIFSAIIALSVLGCSTEPDEDIVLADPNCEGAYLAIPGTPCKAGHVFMVFDQVASCYCATKRQARQLTEQRNK